MSISRSFSLLSAVLVCIQLLQCSIAAPLRTPLNTELGFIQDGVTDLNKEEEKIREARSASWGGARNNYSRNAYKMFTTEWKYNNCTSIDDCGGTVSQHWCNTTLQKKMYCTQDDHISSPGACQITFQLDVDEPGANVVGMDLSLFKQREDPSTDAFYYIYIVYKKYTFHYDIADARVLHSTCNGWQTFHIDPVKEILDFSSVKEQNITLLIAGHKEVEGEMYSMKCDDISSLFILDQKVIIPESDTSHDNNEEDEHSQPMTNKETKEGSSNFYSGENVDDSTLNDQRQVSEDEEEDNESLKPVLLVPLITSFVAGERSFPRFRREEREPINVNGGQNVAFNAPVDAGGIVEEGKKTEDEQSVSNDSVVNCELQDRVVNVTEYIGDDSIIAPQMFNIRQCSPSTSSDQQCVQCEPLYGRLEVLQQIHNPSLNQNTMIITEISGVAVTGCRHKPSSC